MFDAFQRDAWRHTAFVYCGAMNAQRQKSEAVPFEAAYPFKDQRPKVIDPDDAQIQKELYRKLLGNRRA